MSTSKKFMNNRKSSIATPLRVRNETQRNSTSAQHNGRGSVNRPGRPSILTVGRRSSAQENRKETRLQVDRTSVPKLMKSLKQLLFEFGYPNALAANFTLNASAQDVKRILEFVLSFFSIQYNHEAKFEDEYLRIMKLLHFPYNINKRQLQPIGSMHNWPGILHSMVWICTAVKCFKHVQMNAMPPMSDLADENRGLLVVNEMNIKGYTKFMEGVDEKDLDKFEDHFIEQLPRELEIEDQLKQMDSRASELSKKEIELNDEKATNTMLREIISDFESDIKNLNSYLQQMVMHDSKQKMAQQQLEKRNSELTNEIEELKSQVAAKEMIVSTQKLTVQDIHQMKVIKMNLDTQIQEYEDSLTRVQNDLMDVELALLNEQNDLSNLVEDYHNIAGDCKIIPKTASNAQGYDYSIGIPKVNSESFLTNLVEITGRLKIIRKQWRECLRQMKSTKSKVNTDTQKLEEIHQSKADENVQKEAKLKREQETLEIKKDEFSRDIQYIQAELASVEKNISRMNKKYKTASSDYDCKTRLVEESQTRLKKIVQERELKTKEIFDFLITLVEIIVEHKKRVETRVLRFEECFSKWCALTKATKPNFNFDKFKNLLLKYDELENKLNNIIIDSPGIAK